MKRRRRRRRRVGGRVMFDNRTVVTTDRCCKMTNENVYWIVQMRADSRFSYSALHKLRFWLNQVLTYIMKHSSKCISIWDLQIICSLASFSHNYSHRETTKMSRKMPVGRMEKKRWNLLTKKISQHKRYRCYKSIFKQTWMGRQKSYNWHDELKA